MSVDVANVEHVRRGYWQFGDVVRVDPVQSPEVPQPDDRRWLVLVVASTSANRPWTTVFLGGDDPDPVFASIHQPTIAHWDSMHGFARVEE